MGRPVLFDVDPGCDDSVMLLIALAAAEIEVTGVTTIFGNAARSDTTRNALALLEFAGRDDIPVAAGCDRPLVDSPRKGQGIGALDFPSELGQIHGDSGLTVSFPEPSRQPVRRHAVDMIIDQAQEYGEELTIVAAGPQTNLALALAQEPRLPDLVDDIYVMGGSGLENASGNVTPTAGFNCYLDPEAVSRVIQDGAVKLVGMNVSEATYIPKPEIEAFAATGGPYEVIANLIDYYPDAALERYGYEGPVVHDSLIAAELIADVLDYESHYCDVETGEGPFRGATLCDHRGVWGNEPNVEVAVAVDVPTYQRVVMERLDSIAAEVAATD